MFLKSVFMAVVWCLLFTSQAPGGKKGGSFGGGAGAVNKKIVRYSGWRADGYHATREGDDL